MPPIKKRLAAILDSVASIVGGGQKVKELKKTKALKRFILKLEEAKASREKNLASGSTSKKETEKITKQIAELSKQIKKARKVLEKLS